MPTRRKLIAASTVALLLLASISAGAATPAEKRIRFARNRTTATVRGVVTASGGGDYVLRARSGQTLTISLTAAGDTVFSLQSPTGTNMAGEGGKGRAEFQLTEAGDYHISVINRDGKRRSYTLKVTVR